MLDFVLVPTSIMSRLGY